MLLSIIGLSFQALAETVPAPFSALTSAAVSQPQNVLLILADDFGVDIVSAYAEGADFPATPTIDRLANEGVLFRNAWATPKCSSTRATILTGRYGFRTEIMSLVNSIDLRALSLDELIIPEVLKSLPQPYEPAMIGKWHLGNCLNGQRLGPNLAGFSHFAGSFANIVGRGQSFFEWEKTVDGSTSVVHTYATTDSINDAVEWIHHQDDQPWFLYLSLHAPHKPWQIPPYDLVSPSTLERLPKDALGHTRPPGTLCEGDDQRACYLSMVEAMDAEIGRLLASISPEVLAQTTVMFVGDNGTPRDIIRPPFDHDHS
jgi:arylsulfatase A-like enzyme